MTRDVSINPLSDAFPPLPFTSYSLLCRHGRAAHALVLQSFITATIESFLRGHSLSVLFLYSVR